MQVGVHVFLDRYLPGSGTLGSCPLSEDLIVLEPVVDLEFSWIPLCESISCLVCKQCLFLL